MSAKIECPYSKDRLHEMYWKQGMSCYEIARCDSSYRFGAETIRRWLIKNNIKLRDHSQSQKIKLIKYPHLKDNIKKAGQLPRTQNQMKALSAIGSKTIKHTANISAKKRSAKALIFNCDQCSKEVRRRICHVKDSKNRFCSPSCRARFLSLKSKLNKLIASVTPKNYVDPELQALIERNPELAEHLGLTSQSIGALKQR